MYKLVILLSFLSGLVRGKAIWADVKADLGCPETPLPTIPQSHLYLKTFVQNERPVIIAHRGNPMNFQENTLEGILSALNDQGADGFEMDVHLTADNQLVVHHDTNLERMTGTKADIKDLKYAQIAELDLLTEIKTEKGGLYKFNKALKIPLLADVLKVTSELDKVHLIELKPDAVPAPDEHALQRSIKTAEMVADLVKEYNLADKAIIISYDYIKLAAAKKRNPDLVVAALLPDTLRGEDEEGIKRAKEQLVEQIPSLEKCMDSAPTTGEEFSAFISEAEGIFGEIGAVYTVAYSQTGAIFSMNNSKDVNDLMENYLPIIAKETHGIVTDDVKRVFDVLGKHEKPNIVATGLD